MIPSSAPAPPSNEFGANSKSSLKRTAGFYLVHFNGLLLLARTYSSGRYWSGADRFSLSEVTSE
jgi:hypothetical protein